MKNKAANQPREVFKEVTTNRRRLLALIGVTGVAAVATPAKWSKPVLDAVILPAHAQTSMCITDETIGGPLNGNPSGSATCQAACEAEAEVQGAELCAVEETTVSGAVQCGCDFDFP